MTKLWTINECFLCATGEVNIKNKIARLKNIKHFYSYRLLLHVNFIFIIQINYTMQGHSFILSLKILYKCPILCLRDQYSAGAMTILVNISLR